MPALYSKYKILSYELVLDYLDVDRDHLMFV